RHSAYDVMICDIGMEEVDGYELTTAVRQRVETDSMPILLVSARDSDADRQRGLSAGADGFLTKKDCVSGRLLSEVSAVIARRRGPACRRGRSAGWWPTPRPRCARRSAPCSQRIRA